MALVGIVLAGGASRRMGRPKATLEVDGVPLVARVIAALRAAGIDDVVVVGGDPTELERAGVAPHPDDHPGQGPVGGILTALDAFDGDLLVAACDLPDLDADAVRSVVASGEGDVDLAVATSAGHHVVLLRVNRSGRDAVERAFSAGERSLRAIIEACVTTTVEIPMPSALDLDTPGDVEARRSSSR
jgi:molybdenum cofactor guanylyltransferase